MSLPQILFLAVVFLVVSGLSGVVLLQLRKSPLRDRLDQVSSKELVPEPTVAADGWVAKVVKLSGPLAKLSVPEGGWENSRVRIRFMNAGFRGENAPGVFFALKTILALLFPAVMVALTLASARHYGPVLWLGMVVLASAFGYFLPNGVLAHMISRRQREIFESFPDAIDLMTVCVEAGLGLDAALAKVGEEIKVKSKILAEEMHLVTLEIRAGGSRERALRNLALRTGVEEVDSLVAMLIQADRFGTSIADSLRVHAESLRTKRRLQAEERAAKIAVKLLFPMIFFIFPSLLLVLLGPAVISVKRVLLPALGVH